MHRITNIPRAANAVQGMFFVNCLLYPKIALKSSSGVEMGLIP